MFILSKVCCCCYNDDNTKLEPSVTEITSKNQSDNQGVKSNNISSKNETKLNNKENFNNTSNVNDNKNTTENNEVSSNVNTKQNNKENLLENSETAAITNMMLDDITEDDLEQAPIIHSESEIKVDLNAIEEASLDDIYDITINEKNDDKKTNIKDETSSKVIEMLKDKDELDLTTQSEDSINEEESDEEDEEGVEVEIKEITPENKPPSIITPEDSLVNNKSTIKTSAMYGDESDSDSDDSDDESTDSDDTSETSDEAKENITTISVARVEEKKNITVKREGSTITAVPAIIQQELTDDEISEKVI
uniref:Acidic repeat-containing protein n=1 Tax=Strongyloides stercoralis TaxID=6248 RepID=A0A0K0EM57_STRER